jgi:excisionase family DNA binding protein
VKQLDYSSAQSTRSRLLTLSECAERTGTTVRWWRRAVFERKVPVHRLGRLVRVSESDLEEIITSSREPALEEVEAIRQLRNAR